jgi:hypothetical protein
MRLRGCKSIYEALQAVTSMQFPARIRPTRFGPQYFLKANKRWG